MSFTNSNDYLTGRKPIPTGDGYGLMAVRFALVLATADLALNAIGAVGILAARCVPVALYYDSDDLDTGTPALVASVGLLKADGTDLSTAEADGGAGRSEEHTSELQSLMRNSHSVFCWKK